MRILSLQRLAAIGEATSMKILTYDDLKPQMGISYSRVQIWRLEKQNKFPKRLRLGPGRHGWLESELNEWIAARAAERDSGAA
jgi:prophage regulatory protein